MRASELLNQERLSGVVLVLSFILFAIGGTLPVVGQKGNMRIFTLPAREHLLAIADNAVVWRLANIFMGAAAVVLLTGLSILTTILEAANERVFSRLGQVGWLLATVLWVIFSVFRGVVTIRAARELTTAGTSAVPAYYEPLAQWGFGLFYASAVIGFLALAAYGASLLGAGLLPPWVGWATLVFNIAMLIQLLIMGDTLPGLHYLPPLLIGFLLILRA